MTDPWDSIRLSGQGRIAPRVREIRLDDLGLGVDSASYIGMIVESCGSGLLVLKLSRIQ